jgi:hypothetical protein
MESGNKNYSRSQWTTMSIQDRIRAMNHHTSLDGEDGERGEDTPEQPEMHSAVPSKLRLSPTKPRKHKSFSLSPSDETAELSEEDEAAAAAAVPPRRASVVELWRRRESSSVVPSRAYSFSTTMTTTPKQSPALSTPTRAFPVQKLRVSGSSSPEHKGLSSSREGEVGVSHSEEENREPIYNFEEKKEQNFDGDEELSSMRRSSTTILPNDERTEKLTNLSFFPGDHQVSPSRTADRSYFSHTEPSHHQQQTATTNHATGTKQRLCEESSTDGEETVDAGPGPRALSLSVVCTPTKTADAEGSITFEEDARAEETPRKRSSVVDIWMKRGAASASTVGGVGATTSSAATPPHKKLPPLPHPAAARAVGVHGRQEEGSTAVIEGFGGSATRSLACRSPSGSGVSRSSNHAIDFDGGGSAVAIPDNTDSDETKVINESPASRKNSSTLRSKVRTRWMSKAQSESDFGNVGDVNTSSPSQPSSQAQSTVRDLSTTITPKGGSSNVLERWKQRGQDKGSSPSIPLTPRDLSGVQSMIATAKDKGAFSIITNHRAEAMDQNRTSPYNDVRVSWAKRGSDKTAEPLHKEEGPVTGGTPRRDQSNSGPPTTPSQRWSPSVKGLGSPITPHHPVGAKGGHFAFRDTGTLPSSALDSTPKHWSKRAGETHSNTMGFLEASPRRGDRFGSGYNRTTPRSSVGERENQNDNVSTVVLSPVPLKGSHELSSTSKRPSANFPQPDPTDVGCSSGSQDAVDSISGDMQKKKMFPKLGQKHAASGVVKPGVRGPEHVSRDDSCEDSSYADTEATPTESLSTEQTADSTTSGMKTSKPKMSYGFQRWRKDSLKIQTQRLDPATQGPATTQAVNGLHTGEEDADPIANQAQSTGGFRGTKNRFTDKKQLLLARQRHRIKATNRSPNGSADADDSTMDSSALSAAFLDAVPDDEQNQLSHEIMSRRQYKPRGSGVVVAPSVLIEELLAYGPEQSDIRGDDFDYGGQTPVLSPATNSEYASLYVSDSDSYLASEFSKTEPSNPWSPRNGSAHLRLDSNSEISQSFTSGAGSAFTGFAVASPSSIKAGAQSAASPLAARAGRVLQGKRQRKRDDGSPREILVEDTPRIGHRSNPSPAVANDGRRKGPAFRHLEFLDHSMSGTYDTQGQTPTSMLSPTTFVTTGSMNSPSAYGGPIAPRNFSFSSETTGGMTDEVEPTVFLNAFPEKSGAGLPSKRAEKSPKKEIVADNFFSGSSSNGHAFPAYQSLSLEQIANDLKEEVAGSMLTVHALNFARLATDLNQGMSAASESLNKLVGGGGVSIDTHKGKLRVPKREGSPVEEGVAIEVEYIEDSDEE